MPIVAYLVDVVAFMVAMPLVKRLRGLIDAISGAVNVFAKDPANV